MEEVKKEPLSIVEMAGLILSVCEKIQYCTNQILAALEIVKSRVEEFRNLEPIVFEDYKGPVKEIKAFQEAVLRKRLLECLK